jgi:hypothetical protein
MYHIAKSGEMAVCRAKVKACPLGGPHGTRAELEAVLEAEYVPKPLKRNDYSLPPSEPIPAGMLADEEEFWQATRENLGGFVYKGLMFVPSSKDESLSQYYCLKCSHRLPKDDVQSQPTWKMPCPTCGVNCDDGLVGVTLQPKTEPVFHKAPVLEADWYHYTTNENWSDFVKEGNPDARVVHLGSKEAALDRKLATGDKAGRLYKLRLKQDAVIADHVLDDDPFNDEDAPLISRTDDTRKVLVSGVTRYLNYYEDPGSMSLIANPQAFEIVEVSSVD